jgi:REP element-mobilizing transposase RayT
MPQSLARVLVHIVYSTKGRHPWLRDEHIRAQLFAYKAAVLREAVDTPAPVIGGMEDHVHALCSLSRKFCIKDVIEKAKTQTSKWIKQQGVQYADFHWQAGYGIFSVSESNADHVSSYIRRQAEHHKTMSWQDELRELCKRHGIALDERYAWD